RRVHGDLVGAEVQDFLRVGERANAACDAEGDVEDACDAIDPAAVDRPPVRARRDVVEDELVRALVPVPLRELEDVADDPVIAELHALDDLAVANVEAWNDSLRQHLVRLLAAKGTRES